MSRTIAIVVAFSLLPGAAAAQPEAVTPPVEETAPQGQPISLPEALQLAVRQSPELELASIDVDIARARVLQSTGVDDWLLAAGFTFVAGRSLSSGVDRSTSAVLDASLTKSLASGGTLSFHAESAWADSASDSPLSDGSVFTESVSASFNQPLMRGRGRRFARADQAQARAAENVASLAVKSRATSVVLDVILSYWDLVLAHHDLAIRESSLTLARERRRITQATIDAGSGAEADLLAVEQIIATREEEIISSELTIADSSLALRQLLAIEIGPGAIEIAADAPMTVDSHPVDVDALLERAYATNPDLIALAAQEEGATIEVEVTENGLLPQLDLSLSIGPVGRADDPGEATANMATFDDFTATASLEYSQALGKHGASGANRIARAQRQRIRIDLADIKLQIASALVRSIKVLESADKRIALAERAATLSEKNIVAELARLNLGKATNFDVLERQEELKQAQLRRARAIVDWHKAAATISSLTGDLLGEWGVTIEP
jgi:outer membrane protein TolC